MDEFFLDMYLEVATVVLNAASWVLDQYIKMLEWLGNLKYLGWRVRRWQRTHIIHLGPLRIKHHREYILIYTLQRELLFWQFGKKRTKGKES